MAKDMQFHEAAAIFPMMEEATFQTFKEDIQAHGIREPAEVCDGKILDGRNRYRACRELEMPIPTTTWDGKGHVLCFVISGNLHRRHLSQSQRAMIGARIVNVCRNETTKAEMQKGVIAKERVRACRDLRVSENAVSHASKVLNRGTT